MSTLANLLTSQPSVQLRRNPTFYLWYDGVWMAVISAAALALALTGWPGLIDSWRPWHFAVIPVAIYLHVLANVCVHNCCHGNFPRAINRVVAEILGVIVFTRYASWEVLHQRHHRYSDDRERDPHPVGPSFWRFVGEAMMVNLERQLQNEFFDHHGETAQNRRRENLRSVLSFSVMLPLALFWYLLLGPWAFFGIYVPASVVGWLFVAHFNWSTHNAASPEGDYRPVNLDHGLFWIGNRIWFGLYMHGNHHKRANIFNPGRMDRVLAARAARRAEQGDGDSPG